MNKLHHFLGALNTGGGLSKFFFGLCSDLPVFADRRVVLGLGR